MFTWVGIWQKRVRVRRALDDSRPLVPDLESGQVTHTRISQSHTQELPAVWDLKVRVSRIWHYWRFGLNNSFVLGAALCSVPSLAAPCTHWMPLAPSPCLDNQKSLQTFPMSPGGGVQNHPWLRLFWIKGQVPLTLFSFFLPE